MATYEILIDGRHGGMVHGTHVRVRDVGTPRHRNILMDDDKMVVIYDPTRMELRQWHG